MPADIIPMREPRRVTVRRALDEWQRATLLWVEKTIALAVELKAAREDCGDNDTAFGHWLIDNDCDDLGANDRAALIKIAEHIDLSREVLETTSRRSLQHIWANEISPQVTFTHVRIGPSNSEPIPEQAPMTAQTVQGDEPAAPQAPQTNSEPPARRSGRVGRLSELERAPRGNELHALFQHSRTRTLLGTLTGKQVWQLIIAALDAGLLQPNNRCFTDLTSSLLFPSATGTTFAIRYPIGTRRQFAYFRELVLPAMIAHKDELLAAPDRAIEIIERHFEEQRAQARQDAAEQRRNAVFGAMEPGQQELMMFGKTVWPLLDDRHGRYTYDQARAAIWTFRDYEAWNGMLTRDNSVKSNGIRIRNSLRYLTEYMMRTNQRTHDMAVVFNLIKWFSTLAEEAPHAECRWPMYPHRECEW